MGERWHACRAHTWYVDRRNLQPGQQESLGWGSQTRLGRGRKSSLQVPGFPFSPHSFFVSYVFIGCWGAQGLQVGFILYAFSLIGSSCLRHYIQEDSEAKLGLRGERLGMTVHGCPGEEGME